MLQGGRTAIAVSLTEETTAAVVARMADLAPAADLFEVRADFVRDLDLAAVLAARTKPVLLTCRPESEGCAGTGDGVGATMAEEKRPQPGGRAWPVIVPQARGVAQPRQRISTTA